MNPTYEEEDEELSNDEEDEDYLPERQDDDESQIDVNEDGSTGDDLNDEGPTEVDYNESMDDNGKETQNESDLDGYNVAPEMDNTEDLGAESSENSGVSDIENIGVDRAGNEMIYQAEESVDNPELDKDSEVSTENDEKENVTADEVNVESEKESRYNLVPGLTNISMTLQCLTLEAVMTTSRTRWS